MRGIKTKTDSRWKRLGLFLLLLLIFLVLLNSVYKVYKKKKGAEEFLVRMEQNAKDLEEREKFLTESLERLETEEGIKFELRKKLNVAEVGESVAVIVDENEETSLNSGETSYWQKFKNFFRDLF